MGEKIPEPESQNNLESSSEFSIEPILEDGHDCYSIYVGTIEDAKKIVKKFWELMEDKSVLNGLESGMLKTEDMITNGARTFINHSIAKDKKDAGYKCSVFINQNGSKLSEKTVVAVFNLTEIWQ